MMSAAPIPARRGRGLGRSSSEPSTARIGDVLPARLAGVKVPENRVLDGKDIWPLLAGEKGAKSPHEAFYYYSLEQLQALRAGPWKLYLPLEKLRGRGAVVHRRTADKAKPC